MKDKKDMVPMGKTPLDCRCQELFGAESPWKKDPGKLPAKLHPKGVAMHPPTGFRCAVVPKPEDKEG